MKNVMLCVGLVLSLSMSSYANKIDVNGINQNIAAVLAPFQNDTTNASLTFNDIDMRDYLTNSVSLSAHLFKKSSNNQFTFNLQNLRYDYNDGKTPITTVAATISTDFTKIMPQEEISGAISNFSLIFEKLAKEQLGDKLGNALILNSVITSTEKKSPEEYTGLTAIVSAKIDLSKLPQNISSSDVPFINAVFSISLEAKTGIQLNGYVVANPEYIKFKQNEVGLKEILENIANNNQQHLNELFNWASVIDFVITDMMADERISTNPIGNYLFNTKAA